jgi:hypothetical protein
MGRETFSQLLVYKQENAMKDYASSVKKDPVPEALAQEIGSIPVQVIFSGHPVR